MDFQTLADQWNYQPQKNRHYLQGVNEKLMGPENAISFFYSKLGMRSYNSLKDIGYY